MFNFARCIVVIASLACLIERCCAYSRVRPTHRLSSSYSSSWTSLRAASNWEGNVGEGATITNNKIAYFEQGLRGIVCTQPNEPKTPIVVIPADQAFETTNSRPITPNAKFVSDEFWASCMWDQRLALKVLLEMKLIDPTSKSVWIEQWPKTFSTPLHWDSKVFAEVQYDALQTKVQRQRKAWSDFYENWKKVTDPEYASRISLNDMIYALECVNSRAFSGPYEGSSAAERQALFFFTGALTLIWPVAGFGTPETSIALALTVGASIVARDFFFSRVSKLKRYVVCPYIDMFNHKSGSVSDVSYNYFLNQFELCTAAYKQGEQIYISYGKQGNDRLLQFYGFVEEGNPNDYYDFGGSILELVLKYGDELQQEVEFPKGPSPTERLETVATAFANTQPQGKNAQVSALTQGSEDSSVLLFRNAPQTDPQRTIPTTAEAFDPSNLRYRFDEITVRALRLFFAGANEWEKYSVSSTGSAAEVMLTQLPDTLSVETEKKVAKTLQLLAQYEMNAKSTSLESDYAELKQLVSGHMGDVASDSKNKGFSAKKGNKSNTKKTDADKNDTDGLGEFRDARMSALRFRIEKKKLLLEALS